MNVYVLRIGDEVEGVFKSLDEVYTLLKGMVNDDFEWEELKEEGSTFHNFGQGYEEEVRVYKFLI